MMMVAKATSNAMRKRGDASRLDDGQPAKPAGMPQANITDAADAIVAAAHARVICSADDAADGRPDVGRRYRLRKDVAAMVAAIIRDGALADAHAKAQADGDGACKGSLRAKADAYDAIAGIVNGFFAG